MFTNFSIILVKRDDAVVW